MGDECCGKQMINGDGEFKAVDLEHFMKSVKLAECGLSYAAVSIIGPQSSGKSTLLNHLFRTNFTEMDALKERAQTTKGIWIAKCVDIEPFTIVMDLEGTDGSERGEDDTKFEKQSALFALAVSDIVLINIWCNDIGRVQAANRPLLKTVFQVMMRLFRYHKTTLLFVIRDKTKTPMESLENKLKEDIQKIWDSVSKPEIPLSDFFTVSSPVVPKKVLTSLILIYMFSDVKVKVEGLSSYLYEEEQFKEEVSQLRQQFFHSISSGGLTGDRQRVVPASEFSFSAQQIWKDIQDNKDLDLPAHKVMVATVRCEEIANEIFSRRKSDKCWLDLEVAVQAGPVSGFGKKLTSILDAYLSEYDMEAIYFDKGVSSAKRQQLESRALQLVHPAYQTMLRHLHSKAFNNFKTGLEESLKSGEGFPASIRDCTRSCLCEFDEDCKDAAVKQADWDAPKVREKLRCDIEAHTLSERLLQESSHNCTC